MADQSTNSQVDGYTVELTKEEQGQRIIRDLLVFLGEHPEREGLKDTPRRVIKSFKEIYAGYHMDPKKILGTTFETSGYNQMVICKDIEMYSTCEHHMIPFFGKCHIGYIPGDKVVGLSKLARLVEVFSRRLQIQEKLTQQICDTLQDVLKPKGVIVVIEAKHMCMCARGIGKQNSMMITSAIKGMFEKMEGRSEFMELIR